MAEETPDPITKELRDAFEEAISRFGNWRRGESEPVVSLNSQSFSISAVCALVDRFEGPMADGHWHLLATVMPGGDDLPNDQSYQSAARFLAKLIRERKERFDRPDPD